VPGAVTAIDVEHREEAELDAPDRTHKGVAS
jgi:hypothetical protein